MNHRVRALRNTASQVCKRRDFPFSQFMDHGLEEILERAQLENWSAQDMAEQVIVRCCVNDGKFNNFAIGVLTVITFLRQQIGPLGRHAEQAVRDLHAILTKEPTRVAIRGWLTVHYPPGPQLPSE
jgi:hypothetical protein